MEYFLERISKSLLTEFGNNLNRHCLVFPSRRAGLYFKKYLADGISKPVWVPSIMTVNELFRSFSDLQIAENELLLFKLYKVYRAIAKVPESFDEFYFWGETLVNDFDDVDKYLADASLLFRNIKDVKLIDLQFGGLTEEQIEIIKRFWTNINPDKLTNEKDNFLKMWALLSDLYTGFRDLLRKENLAYEGMIFRDLAENAEAGVKIEIEWDMLHFIGFNALNNCEKKIMAHFRSEGKARFYWDYDHSFAPSGKLSSAGFFMSSNLKSFGDDMPPDWNHDTIFSSRVSQVNRRIISTSSDVSQVKLISRLIADIPDLSIQNAHHTAVVLADENLLIPALTSLPENIGDINITMGYPLCQTSVYTLISNILVLQRNARCVGNTAYFNHGDVMRILKNGLIAVLMNDEENKLINEIIQANMVMVPSVLFEQSNLLSPLFTVIKTPHSLAVYMREILIRIAEKLVPDNHEDTEPELAEKILKEFIYRVLMSINRLDAITGDPEISFTKETYMRILDRILRSQSVPFSGEPLSGIQIMGILETRALDFRNLIMLSVNEGIIPAISAGSSFIPYNLRVSFGLPDISHQESVYAYHFFRLLQRAENVTFMYNSNSEGLRTGEMSRFLFQMKFDPALKPDIQSLEFRISSQNLLQGKIMRTEEHMKRILSLYNDTREGRILSPTAINTWLSCRMRFYYRYVNGLKEVDRVAPDIDPAMLGSMLHEVMKNLYMGFIGSELSTNKIDMLIVNDIMLENIINNAVIEIFKAGEERIQSGKELIIKEVLKTYVLRILKTDRRIAPFNLLEIEKSYTFRLPVVSNDKQIGILIGGDIDRIDRIEETIRIVDYKTGSVNDKINSLESLFEDDRSKELDAWLQTLVYCETYVSKHPDAVVWPTIYRIKESDVKVLSDKLRIKEGKNDLIIEDYKSIRREFLSLLSGTIEKIFSNDEPFIMTDALIKCSYCPFKGLCMR